MAGDVPNKMICVRRQAPPAQLSAAQSRQPRCVWLRPRRVLTFCNSHCSDQLSGRILTGTIFTKLSPEQKIMVPAMLKNG